MVGIPGRVDATAVATLLRDIAAPIFAAAWLRGRSSDVLFVHVAAAPKRAALRRQIADALRSVGVQNVSVRFHNEAQLQSPRSLERLVARFAGDEIIYDPTSAVGRAKALVAAGQAVRASLDGKLFGLFYAPRERTFYVALKAASLAAGDKLKISDLAEIERAVGTAMKSAFVRDLADCPSVRVGFGLPRTHLVAVDSRSVVRWSAHVAHAVRRLWKPVTLAALFGFGMAGTAAARDPAVSETNVKVTGTAGEVNGNGAWEFNGALTAPLGQLTGLQVEGGASSVDGDTSWGTAAHLFTRDPDKYLLGVFAAYAQENDFNLDSTRIGAEAEIYLNQVTVLAEAGYQFSNKLDDTAFASLDLRWYATDNFWVSGGGHFEQDVNQAVLQAEFMPGFSALPGLAFNVRGVIGDNDDDSVMGGITYYFGSDASLKDRHRKQDPDSALFGLFKSVEQQSAAMVALYGHPAH